MVLINSGTWPIGSFYYVKMSYLFGGRRLISVMGSPSRGFYNMLSLTSFGLLGSSRFKMAF
jgi:hypothetical protein